MHCLVIICNSENYDNEMLEQARQHIQQLADQSVDLLPLVLWLHGRALLTVFLKLSEGAS